MDRMDHMDLKVNVGSLELKNPLIAASGTMGFGREAKALYDPAIWGGISSKGLTVNERLGNPVPRVAETDSGMLNAVGLQNPGLQKFLATELDFMASLGTAVIVNAAGHATEDYLTLVETLGAEPQVDAIELNFSCPNVTEGCMTIGSDPKQIEWLVKKLRARTKKPLWVKLTPNITSIADAALAAEAAGADAISLVNTFLAMRIDIKTRRPILANVTGGLSGPAIKPIALRMVHEVYEAVKIPVVGMGGIASAEDVIEFMLAGASAVQIGTAQLIHPYLPLEILDRLPSLLEELGFSSAAEVTGKLEAQ